VKRRLAVMTLPYSDAFFVSAYPRECTETFQAGDVAALEFFRRRADEDGVRQHEARGQPDRGSERGTLAREFCCWRGIPVHAPLLPGRPSFASFTELNAHSATAERLIFSVAFVASVRPMPAARRRPLIDAAIAGEHVEPRGSSSGGPARCRWRGSTSTTTRCRPAYAPPRATVMIERIEISSGSELVATHPRDWGAEQPPTTRVATWRY